LVSMPPTKGGEPKKDAARTETCGSEKKTVSLPSKRGGVPGSDTKRRGEKQDITARANVQGLLQTTEKVMSINAIHSSKAPT